jgi:hypothetical protein
MRPKSEAQGNHASIETLARIGGALYLIIIVVGLFGEAVVRDRILVPGDAGRTAANLRSLESLWRLGIAAECVLLPCAIALLPILYVLLRPVNRVLALTAVFFDLISIAVEAVGVLFLVLTLFPVGRAPYLAAFEPGQLNAMSSLAARAHAQTFGIALVFFGWFCVIAGYLIFRSDYLPKAIGVLMQIAGACYLVNSFALTLAPALASRLFPMILLPCLVGEASFCLWLLVKGVDVEKWMVSERGAGRLESSSCLSTTGVH